MREHVGLKLKELLLEDEAFEQSAKKAIMSFYEQHKDFEYGHVEWRALRFEFDAMCQRLGCERLQADTITSVPPLLILPAASNERRNAAFVIAFTKHPEGVHRTSLGGAYVIHLYTTVAEVNGSWWRHSL